MNALAPIAVDVRRRFHDRRSGGMPFRGMTKRPSEHTGEAAPRRWLDHGAPDVVRALLQAGLAIEPPAGAKAEVLARILGAPRVARAAAAERRGK
jgi:hypothetical protein